MRPSPRRPDPRDDPAALCARNVLDLVPRAMRLLREEMRREAGVGLSVPQFRVLAFLGRSPGASLSAVAAFLGVADATASAMVDRLVRRRLLTRGEDPAERRRVALALTAQGTALLARSRAHTRAWMEVRLAGLSRPQLLALANGLALLDRALGGPAGPGEKP
jgi:DNA-binding MarR family transcriptional regulator